MANDYRVELFVTEIKTQKEEYRITAKCSHDAAEAAYAMVNETLDYYRDKEAKVTAFTLIRAELKKIKYEDMPKEQGSIKVNYSTLKKVFGDPHAYDMEGFSAAWDWEFMGTKFTVYSLMDTGAEPMPLEDYEEFAVAGDEGAVKTAEMFVDMWRRYANR